MRVCAKAITLSLQLTPPFHQASRLAKFCFFSNKHRCLHSSWVPFSLQRQDPRLIPPSSKCNRSPSSVSDYLLRFFLSSQFYGVFTRGYAAASKVVKKKTSIKACTSVSYSGVSPDDITVICFDLETTGFSASKQKIIEIAARDLAGGALSTMQSLVNPGRYVPEAVSRANSITTDMVFRPDVPRFDVVGRAFVEFVKMRKKNKKFVVLAAHNGKTFDVPFLSYEFLNSNIEMPSDWLFLDTYLFAKHVFSNVKSEREKPKNLKLEYLHSEHFRFPSQGKAHRAMADANMLAHVLPHLTHYSGVSPSSFLEHCFKPEPVEPPSVPQELRFSHNVDSNELWKPRSMKGLKVRREAKTQEGGSLSEL